MLQMPSVIAPLMMQKRGPYSRLALLLLGVPQPLLAHVVQSLHPGLVLGEAGVQLLQERVILGEEGVRAAEGSWTLRGTQHAKAAEQYATGP